MSEPRRSPLFSAIVLAGVALTGGVVGCSDDETVVTPDDATSTTDTAKADTATTDTAATTTDSAADVGGDGDASTAHDSEDADDADAACPPGSDRPVPPCSFIK